MIVLQCEGCGRVRDSGDWRFDSTVKVDILGHCGMCGTLRKQKQEREWRRTGRRLLLERRLGYSKSSSGDPFKNFREEK